ncbi:WD40 repeat domain-containing protein [Burkholderia anthina]|uniref:WD40 repeat domain-containing protein n=1 Tax=Burkholderia anthina TaxID=179879 RepID=UPI00158B7535|nr:WD40 repeat domain-containing protein [Burkholderia anthina]
MNMTTSSLIEWLGAQWHHDASVVALAWNETSQTFGFALGDGSLVLTSTRWPAGPSIQVDASGRTELTVQQEPPSAPFHVHAHQNVCLSLAPDFGDGFVSSGDDGRLVRTTAKGVMHTLAENLGWINHVATSATGALAFAADKQVRRLSSIDQKVDISIDLPSSATALAFDPCGSQLAIAHHDGVTLWPVDGEPRRLVWPGYHRAMAWSRDGRYLFTGMQENALHGWRLADNCDIEMGGYPGQPLSLSFLADGRMLATSGAPRVTCWRIDTPERDAQPLQCGIASKTPVTVVACHPIHALIATGYHNGAVLLTQPGNEDVVFVKGSGGGAVSALAWSDDGTRLALGTDCGLIGWVNLPPSLFRFNAHV